MLKENTLVFDFLFTFVVFSFSDDQQSGDESTSDEDEAGDAEESGDGHETACNTSTSKSYKRIAEAIFKTRFYHSVTTPIRF